MAGRRGAASTGDRNRERATRMSAVVREPDAHRAELLARRSHQRRLHRRDARRPQLHPRDADRCGLHQCDVRRRARQSDADARFHAREPDQCEIRQREVQRADVFHVRDAHLRRFLAYQPEQRQRGVRRRAAALRRERVLSRRDLSRSDLPREIRVRDDELRVHRPVGRVRPVRRHRQRLFRQARGAQLCERRHARRELRRNDSRRDQFQHRQPEPGGVRQREPAVRDGSERQRAMRGPFPCAAPGREPQQRESERREPVQCVPVQQRQRENHAGRAAQAGALAQRQPGVLAAFGRRVHACQLLQRRRQPGQSGRLQDDRRQQHVGLHGLLRQRVPREHDGHAIRRRVSVRRRFP